MNKAFWIPLMAIFSILGFIFALVVHKVWLAFELSTIMKISMVGISVCVIVFLFLVSAVCAVHIEQWYKSKKAQRS